VGLEPTCTGLTTRSLVHFGIDLGASGASRTRTGRVLNPVPLPLGYEGSVPDGERAVTDPLPAGTGQEFQPAGPRRAEVSPTHPMKVGQQRVRGSNPCFRNENPTS
jgi:hypothetical protein